MSLKNIIKEFSRIDDLLKTEKTMKDIFVFSTSRKTYIASEYFDNETFKRDRYRDITAYVDATSLQIHKKLKEIPKHSTIGLLSPTTRKWHIILWSLLKAGYKPVLINERSNSKEINDIIKQANIDVVIANKQYEIEAKIVLIEEVYSEISIETFELWEDEIAFCTSGTEGKSKIMVYTGKNLVYQIASARKLPYFNKDIMYTKAHGAYRNLALLPFSHIFGFVAVYLWTFFFGKTIVYPESLDFKHINTLTTRQNRKITHIYAVPLFWNHVAKKIEDNINSLEDKKKESLLNMMKYNNGEIDYKFKGYLYAKLYLKAMRKKIFDNHIRFMISGGGFLPQKTIKIINGVGYRLHNGYGSTEAGVCCVDLSNDRKTMNLNSIGKPFYMVNFKIEDDQNYGQLLINSNILYSYYYEEGIKHENKEEWYQTGDIVKKDEQGMYYMIGRQKEMLVGSDGKNVSPDEIEEYFLNGLEAINLSSVIVDNDYIALVIQLKDIPQAEEIVKFKDNLDSINYTLSSYKRVKKYFLTTEPLPITKALKSDRREILTKIKNNEYVDFNELFLSNVKEDVLVENSLDQYYAEIAVIIKKIMGNVNMNIHGKANLIETYGFDSFKYLELVFELEQKYNIVITNEEGFSCSNIVDFSILVRKKLRDGND